jgi:hypothetical protein
MSKSECNVCSDSGFSISHQSWHESKTEKNLQTLKDALNKLTPEGERWFVHRLIGALSVHTSPEIWEQCIACAESATPAQDRKPAEVSQ